jgi:Prokaryotic N-terminal methylation motif
MLIGPRTAAHRAARLAGRRLRPRDERGFTLIETLVAMVTGVIVIGALFAILEVSLHQSSRLTNEAEATQLGRSAMTRVTDELHSACLSSGFAPVQEKSGPLKLIVVDGYSEQSEIPLSEASTHSEVREDEIVWVAEPEPTGKGRGYLKDYVYPATAGPNAEGTYSFSATPTVAGGTVIGEKVEAPELENPKTKAIEKTVFRYYEYATKANSATTSASSALNETPLAVEPSPGFSKTQAESVAAVAVRFTVSPSSRYANLEKEKSINQAGTQSTQTTLTFSAPSSEATLKAGPCE